MQLLKRGRGCQLRVRKSLRDWWCSCILQSGVVRMLRYMTGQLMNLRQEHLKLILDGVLGCGEEQRVNRSLRCLTIRVENLVRYQNIKWYILWTQNSRARKINRDLFLSQMMPSTWETVWLRGKKTTCMQNVMDSVYKHKKDVPDVSKAKFTSVEQSYITLILEAASHILLLFFTGDELSWCWNSCV